MKEREQAIQEYSQRYLACERILRSWDLPECQREWFERERDETRRHLTDLGVDSIIGEDGKEEGVIFRNS